MSPDAARVRVLVADDSHQIREALCQLIDDDDGLELVGQAVDATTAVELARTARPDVVVLDGRMPGGGGAAALGALSAEQPDVAVIVLSAYDDLQSRIDLAGADRFVSKGERVDLIALIREVVSGQRGGGRSGSAPVGPS